MIKLIDNFDFYDFSSFQEDVFFHRIYSDYKSLSAFEDALFYVSVNDEKVDAVISKIGSDVTISADKNAPFDEIYEFLNVIGCSVILCEESFSEPFHGEKTKGKILKIDCNVTNDCKADLLYTENLQDMYKLQKDVFDISFDFPFWFADISHRIRHGAADFCGIYDCDLLICGAFALFKTNKSAVISSLATKESYRRRGYGENVLKRLLNENLSKTVYVFVENEKVENWYKKFGFTEYKQWSEIKNVL